MTVAKKSSAEGAIARVKQLQEQMAEASKEAATASRWASTPSALPKWVRWSFAGRRRRMRSRLARQAPGSMSGGGVGATTAVQPGSRMPATSPVNTSSPKA